MLLSDQASVHPGYCGHESESSDTANSPLALSGHQMPISLLPELCRDRIQHHVFRGNKVFHCIQSAQILSSWELMEAGPIVREPARNGPNPGV